MFPELGHFGAPIAPGRFPEAGDGAPALLWSYFSVP